MEYLFIGLSVLVAILLLLFVAIIQFKNNSALSIRIDNLRNDLEKTEKDLKKKVEKVENATTKRINGVENTLTKRMTKVEEQSSSNDATLRKMWGSISIN